MRKPENLLWRFKIWCWQQGTEEIAAIVFVIFCVITLSIVVSVPWIFIWLSGGQ